MHLKITMPSKAFIESITDAELEKLTEVLSYTNTAAQHMVKRHYNMKWLKEKNRAAWAFKLEELKKAVHHTLIWEEDGKKYIRPGSIPYLRADFNITVENTIVYPTPKAVGWKVKFPYDRMEHQLVTENEMIADPHSSCELCTSAGKSAILLHVCRNTGFSTVIVVPSKSIFHELLDSFEKYLGKAQVGGFGDGKKVIGKKFTIAIGDSLANIKQGTVEWEFFSTRQQMCVDESHTWGADSLNDICHGVLGDVPCRHFFSGTQTRNDGAEKLLQSIIGRIVYDLPTWLAKERKIVAEHVFNIVELESSNPNFHSNDALEMKREHFLGNRNICAFVAKMSNAVALAYGQQTLVLVEELKQISMLSKLLKVPYAIAHSESKKERLLELGLEKVDPSESVEKFNKNEVKVLIGTSCIATGTNIYPVHHCHNWVGGASEIKTAQGTVGRSVRHGHSNPWADKCAPKPLSTIWGYAVMDVPIMMAHLDKQLEVYCNSRSVIKRIKIK